MIFFRRDGYVVAPQDTPSILRPISIIMTFRRFLWLALAPIALVACKDTNQISANTAVAPDTLVAYAMSGTPTSYPSALNTVGRTSVRMDGTANFDVGFDLDPSGNVIVYPVRLLVSPLVGARQVGLLTTTTPYDSLTRAPNGYYRPDTAVTVSIGQTLVILSNRNSAGDLCVYFASPRVYAKMVVDSVNLLTRSIHFRHTVDPNCGYRSFLSGFPTS